MFEVNKNPSRRDIRNFGWAMLFGWGVIGVVCWVLGWLRGGDGTLFGYRLQAYALASWACGVLLWMLCFLTPHWLSKPVYVIWMTVATRIGIVMSTVLLSVLFFVLLPPFSLLIRLGDPLRKKLTTGGTYWEDYKPHEATLERVARPF